MRAEDEDRREEMILVRVSRAEKRTLAEAARMEGLGVSSWLRQLGLRAARKATR
jgi:hypothetical protein